MFAFRLQLEQSNKPKREIKQIKTVVNNYKPVTNHQFNVSHTYINFNKFSHLI